jgi:hypothetical protein
MTITTNKGQSMSANIEVNTDTQGSVYILSNPAFSGLLKIGFTTKQTTERAKALYSTGVPDRFTIEYEGDFSNAHQVEKKVHQALSNVRYKPNREFFRCDLTTAINTIQAEAKKIGVSVVNSINHQYERRILSQAHQQKAKEKKMKLIEGLLFLTTLPVALWFVLNKPVILDTLNQLILTVSNYLPW